MTYLLVARTSLLRQSNGISVDVVNWFRCAQYSLQANSKVAQCLFCRTDLFLKKEMYRKIFVKSSPPHAVLEARRFSGSQSSGSF